MNTVHGCIYIYIHIIYVFLFDVIISSIVYGGDSLAVGLGESSKPRGVDPKCPGLWSMFCDTFERVEQKRCLFCCNMLKLTLLVKLAQCHVL